VKEQKLLFLLPEWAVQTAGHNSTLCSSGVVCCTASSPAMKNFTVFHSWATENKYHLYVKVEYRNNVLCKIIDI